MATFLFSIHLRLSMPKSVNFLFILILMISSLMVGCAGSEITEPSVPEFTLRYVDNSYDVPPTTTTATDPYTGNTTVTTQPAYRVFNQSIEVIIENKPFTPYTDTDGHYVNLAYTVRWKGYYSDSWNMLPNRTAYFGARNVDGYGTPPYSEYTTIVFGLDWKENAGVRGAEDFFYDYYLGGVPIGGQIDFQVQASIGYSVMVSSPRNQFQSDSYYMIFTGETSEWSNTQTITIPENQTQTPTPAATTPTPSTTITPYQEPQQMEQEVIVGLAITAAVLAVGLGLLFYLIKRK
jgi:hypothetical protein